MWIMKLNYSIHELFMGAYKPSALSMKKYQILKGGRSSAKTSRHVTRIVLESMVTPNLISWVIGREQGQLQTGLVAEFTKVIERVAEGQLKKEKNADYWVLQKPLRIKFSNGSEIYFTSSKNAESLRGRTLDSAKQKWGFILLDEFATYSEQDGRNIIKELAPTFSRGAIPEGYQHFYWRGDKLSALKLDKIKLDDDDQPVYEENEYGELQPVIIPGEHTLGAQFLVSYNPPDNKYHWVYDWLEEYEHRPDTLCKTVNYTDVYKELVSLGLLGVIGEANMDKEQNPIKYRHVWLGEAVSKSGLYFTQFEPKACRVPQSFVENINHQNLVIAVDVGVSNATTFTAKYLDSDDNRITLDMYYHSNRDVDNPIHEKSFSDYANDLLLFADEVCKKYHISTNKPINTYVDPSAKGFMLEVKKVMAQRRRYTLKVLKAHNDRESTLGLVRGLISDEKFKYVYPSKYAHHLENEFLRAEINPKSEKEDIIKKNDHLIDSERYACWALDKKALRNARRGWLNG